MLRNQEKLEEQMRERYSVEKLFDNASAKVVTEEGDLEKEDFTKPKVVQRYSQYTQNNEDIQDFTDHVEERQNSSLNSNPSLAVQNNMETACGFFARLKQKICSFFKKSEKEKFVEK